MQTRRIVTAAVLAATVLLVVVTCRLAPGPARAPVQAPDARAEAAADAGLAVAPLDPTRVEAAPAASIPSSTADAETVPDDEALFARLRATARAFLEHEEARLANELEGLLAGPLVPRRVLALTESEHIVPGSLEAEGALLCLAFATAVEARGRSLALAGLDFRADFLDALARLDPDVGTPLAEFTARLRANGRPCIGVGWIERIERLRLQRPEHAVSFDPLLALLSEAAIDGALDEPQCRELARIVTSSNDALAVEAALSVLLAARPDEFVPVAERLFADSAAAADLRRAVVTAVARHAPVEAASQSLARLARDDQYGAFAALGARPGGLDAAGRRYSELASSDSDARARKMLVSSMGGERTDVLLGIARTETSDEVRGQALLTATLRPVTDPEVVRTLRDLHALRGGVATSEGPGGRGLSTTAAILVADNLLLNGQGAARADAVRFLCEIVSDAAANPADRRAAWDRLRASAGPDDLAGLQAPP